MPTPTQILTLKSTYPPQAVIGQSTALFTHGATFLVAVAPLFFCHQQKAAVSLFLIKKAAVLQHSILSK